ncbi:DUF1515 family protein [Rhodoligotrophos defluvii]|uniref:DUF1515 family protein n=1 Tax=Rhodoligotrophos defluvii TaxID=2561934 RepID=UPI0010C95535|nr:DUF1515 family protein [Rhodoligotrophos defluvii]
MTSQLDDISSAIGELRTDVRHLLKAIDQNEQRAAVSRQVLHEKVEKLDERFRVAEAHAREVPEIKVKVERLYARQHWERGVIFSLAMIGGLAADWLRRKLGG